MTALLEYFTVALENSECVLLHAVQSFKHTTHKLTMMISECTDKPHVKFHLHENLGNGTNTSLMHIVILYPTIMENLE